MLTTPLSYQQARLLIKQKLKNVNLREFCKKNKIPYQELQNLKSNHKIQYNTILKQTLQGLGYNVSKIESLTLFHLKPKK
jgi:hypothetical protein